MNQNCLKAYRKITDYGRLIRVKKINLSCYDFELTNNMKYVVYGFREDRCEININILCLKNHKINNFIDYVMFVTENDVYIIENSKFLKLIEDEKYQSINHNLYRNYYVFDKSILEQCILLR